MMSTLRNWPKGKKEDKEYDPAFAFVDGSKKANRIKGDQWNDTMFEMSVDVYEEDINFINSPMPTSQDLQEHLAFMFADNKRKNWSQHSKPKCWRKKTDGSCQRQRGWSMDLKFSFQDCKKGRHTNQTHNGNEMDLDLERSPRRDHSKSTTGCKRIHWPWSADNTGRSPNL